MKSPIAIWPIRAASRRWRQDGVVGQLSIRPLSPTVGVELDGVDFTQPFDQDLSDDDHLRACRYLLPVLDPVSYVSNVEPLGFHPELPLMFHSDYTFTP